MDHTVNESDYTATQAIFGTVLVLSIVGIAATVIVAILGGVLQ